MSCDIPYGPERKAWEETLSPLAKANGAILVSPPSKDPSTLYDFSQEPITAEWYQVPSAALGRDQRIRAFAETARAVKVAEENSLGYRISFKNHVNSTAVVKDSFMTAHLSNGGSPFSASYSGLAPMWMERNVLDYFASLWNAKWPHDPQDPDSYWGYLLTMGSTEGNLHALWNARDYLSGKYMCSGTDKSRSALSNYLYSQCACPADNPNAFSPVIFYSQDAHYSIMKASEIMAVTSFYEMGTQKYPDECPLGGEWPLALPCTGGDNGPGSLDIEVLKTLVDFFSAKGHPIMVIFSYGTTSEGAYDDVKAAGEALVPILKKNNMYERTFDCLQSTDSNGSGTTITRKGFWFHVDGALGAAYAPFLQMAYQNGLTELTPPPIFDFRLDFVSSIVTSGHKFIGVSWPCGVYISKTEFQLRQPDSAHIDYIESPDFTLAGSRNGHSSIALWSYISTCSYEEQAERAVDALKTAPSSLAVRFKRPNERISQKYCLCRSWAFMDGEWRQCVHIYTIDGEVRLSKIDELIEALHSPDAFT